MSKNLIIGGLGFIGSNLARELLKSSHEVTIINKGKNELFRINDFKDKIDLVDGSILDLDLLKEQVKDKDFIFNFAAILNPEIISKNKSLAHDIDVIGQKNILEACKINNKHTKIIFPSSRLVYGKPVELPIKESHSLNPLTDYAKNKVLAEGLCHKYSREHNINSVIIRMPQPYGPGQQVKYPVGISGFLIAKALKNETITIFGDGSQLRDYPFIQDVTEAIIKVSNSKNINNKTYNLGSGVGIKFIDFVKTIVELTGSGKIEHIPFPEEHLKYETGSAVLDISKIKRDLDWSPKTKLKDGLKLTIDHYRKNLSLYI